MKKIIVLLTFFSFQLSSYTQEEILNDTLKSTVYFISSYNPMKENIFLEFFDGEKYLGELNGNVFYKYECNPGIHQFWVESGSFSVLESDLLAENIYVIFLGLKGLLLLDPAIVPIHKNLKTYKKEDGPFLIDIFENRREVVISEEKIQKRTIHHEKAIKKAMRYFKVMHLHKLEIPTMTSEMYYCKKISIQ